MKTRSIWATAVFVVGAFAVLQSACSTAECATDADCEATLGGEYECRVAAGTCVKRGAEDAGETDGGVRTDGGSDSGVGSDGGADAGWEVACVPGCNLGQRCINGACACDEISCPNGCCAANSCVRRSDCGTCANTCQWNPTGPLSAARSFGHTATLLLNGKVLIAGGNDSAVCELYDPTTNAWSAAAPTPAALRSPSSELLASGKVLLCGGAVKSGGSFIVLVPQNLCYLYDPSTDSWSQAGTMKVARSSFALERTSNGRVLAAGGRVSAAVDGQVSSAEIYDPVGDSWADIPPLSSARADVGAASLSDGRVLVTPGDFQNTAVNHRSEVFNPGNSTWKSVGPPWDLHGSTAVALENGKVLVAGGTAVTLEGSVPVNRAAVIDPTDGTYIEDAMPTSLASPAGVLLSSGRVLVVSGTTASIFDPATNQWIDGGTLSVDRQAPTATRLSNGNILVVGGDNTADIFR